MNLDEVTPVSCGVCACPIGSPDAAFCHRCGYRFNGEQTETALRRSSINAPGFAKLAFELAERLEVERQDDVVALALARNGRAIAASFELVDARDDRRRLVTELVTFQRDALDCLAGKPPR